ncbi:galactokinase [bacterium]|nr:galactokinase [bacterium]
MTVPPPATSTASGPRLLSSRQVLSERSDAAARVRAALVPYFGPDENLLEDARRRLAQLAALHEQATGARCNFIRTPGRINLIGEHTDYNGLPVLPMTLQRDILIAYSARRDDRVVLRNARAEYAPAEFRLSARIPPSPPGDWSNYNKAAAEAVAAESAGSAPRGADLTVGGNLPGNAGLSSSSALVVSAALALLHVNRIRFDRTRWAERLAEAEHYVGTRGGGMDQAIALLGQPGHALCIDFFPLRAQSVPLPDELCVVAAHSLVHAHKTGDRRLDYNLRPLECMLAVAFINRLGRVPPIDRLGRLESQMSLEEAAALVQAAIPDTRYSLSTLESDMERGSLLPLSQARQLVSEFGLSPETPLLQPRRRALHVLAEGRRVRDTVRALAAGDYSAVGRLLSASDRSCHELYEIGTPELAHLSDLCRRHGALGSRLTGAGFGGFVISLVPAARAQELMDAIAEEYYGQYLRARRPDLHSQRPSLGEVLFVATSTRGADRLTWPE